MNYFLEARKQELLRQVIAIKADQMGRYKTDDDFKKLVNVLRDLKAVKNKIEGNQNVRH